MAPRPTPPPAEIAEILRNYYSRQAQYGKDVSEYAAIPMGSAVSAVRSALATTNQRAETWLKTAAVAEDRPFIWVQTYASMIAYDVIRNADSEGKSPYALRSLENAGLGVTEADPSIRLDYGGKYVATRTDNDAGKADFIIFRSTFDSMLARARVQYTAEEAEREAQRAESEALAYGAHGDSIRVLKSLLTAAGVKIDEDSRSEFRVHGFENFTRDRKYTTVKIELYNEDIATLAEYLKGLGVRPE